jgi:hypothetical protein
VSPRSKREVPPGYVVHRVADATLVFDAALASELVGLGSRIATRKRLFLARASAGAARRRRGTAARRE